MACGAFELLEDGSGTLDDDAWHACYLGYVYAEAVFRAASLELAQEDDLPVDFLDADIEVLDALEAAFHLVQFVVVCGKKRAGASLAVLVDVLHDGPCDGDAVVGARAATEFVEEHQAALGEVVQDAGCLVHLHHEGALADADVVAGPDAGEDLVHVADACSLGRHEAAHLSQQGDEGRLAEQGALAGHVGSGDDDDLLLLCVEEDVVRDVAFAHG